MKKHIYPTVLLLMLWGATVVAQNAGCDGIRYKQNVFTAVKKTTVMYAPTVSHLGGAMNLSMDVYEPEGDPIAQRPVVVLAHGGSFIFGDRTMMDSYCILLAKKGYVAATISYRLWPLLSLGFPDSLDIFDTAVKAVGDMRAAVRYFREDAATTNQFKADIDHIYIGGYSAGAVTALHCSYLDSGDDVPAFLNTLINNNGGLEGVSGTTSNKTYGSQSKAVVNMSGGLYRSEWIDANEVPLVSIHGTADETVPYVSGLAANVAYLEGSSRLHTRAEAVGVWNSLLTVPGGGHTNIYDNATYKPMLDSFWVNATHLLESLTCLSVGVETPSDGVENWLMWPNPSSSRQITIQLPEWCSTADARILNATGALVSTIQHVVSGQPVHLGNLPAGLYLVELQNTQYPEKRLATQKLVLK